MAKPSGKTQIRILPALHAHLIRIADEEGKSLNSLIETLLAGGSNFKISHDPDRLPVQHRWGSPIHVEQIAERLGHFEAQHLQHELQMSEHAARTRLKVLLAEGKVTEVEPTSNYRGAIYEWAGPK